MILCIGEILADMIGNKKTGELVKYQKEQTDLGALDTIKWHKENKSYYWLYY